MTEEKKITILHFNDVYNIESRDKVREKRKVIHMDRVKCMKM